MKSLLSCPVCGEKLNLENKTYKCSNRHCFDVAKEGYVNLLMSNKSNDVHGDDKNMVASRTLFLGKGFYSPLREKICDIIKNKIKEDVCLLDAGCGEGYYTASYAEIASNCVGVDISKAAVKHASKTCKNAEFAVASVYRLPVAENSIDVVVNCFSPNAPSEFSRVLKNGGLLIYVVPAPRHLWELKQVLYDTPYENEEKYEEYEGFTLCEVVPVTTHFELSNNEEILSLFHMTPYTWNTPEDGIERLKGIEKLGVTADFRIHVFTLQK